MAPVSTLSSALDRQPIIAKHNATLHDTASQRLTSTLFSPGLVSSRPRRMTTDDSSSICADTVCGVTRHTIPSWRTAARQHGAAQQHDDAKRHGRRWCGRRHAACSVRQLPTADTRQDCARLEEWHAQVRWRLAAEPSTERPRCAHHAAVSLQRPRLTAHFEWHSSTARSIIDSSPSSTCTLHNLAPTWLSSLTHLDLLHLTHILRFSLFPAHSSHPHNLTPPASHHSRRTHQPSPRVHKSCDGRD